MFDARRIRDDFSRAAPQYDAHAGLQERVLRALLAKAAPFLAQGGLVLDAGCGTGRLAAHLPDHDVIALDLAFRMCEMAAGGGPAVNADIERLPFADGRFGLVFSSLALQWATNPAAALRELRRVRALGGALAVSRFGPATLQELKESFAAVDPYPHVSPFASVEKGEESETITEYVPDVKSLMRQLKRIGAANKLAVRRKSLMTPAQLARVEDAYRARFAGPHGLAVTWQILYRMETT